MKRAAFTLISFITLAINGCSDDSKVIVPQVSSKPVSTATSPITPTTPTNPTTPTTSYTLTFKANGTTVTETEVSATRGITTTPRTLTITGTGSSGAVPKFKIFIEESFIGFVKGLNVGNSTSTYPSSYIEYTNSTNDLYATKNDANGIYVFLSDVSYTDGGTITGTFSGSIKTESGTAVQITDGAFNAKFSN